MKVVIFSLQNDSNFEIVVQKVKRKFENLISVFPNNVKDKKTLISILNDQTSSDEIIIEYDTNFIDDLRIELDNKLPIQFFVWSDSVSNLFDQIGFSAPKPDENFNVSKLLEKFSQNAKENSRKTEMTSPESESELEPVAKPINYRPKSVIPPKKVTKTIIRVIGNGGVGKTLIALNLCDFLKQKGLSAVVIGDHFTFEYAKNRVSVIDFANLAVDFKFDEMNEDFVIFDGIDGEDDRIDDGGDGVELVSQKWLIVKNRIEFNFYSDFYENMIYNDSDGYLKKALNITEFDHFLPFSESIFKHFQNREELLLSSTPFEHLVLFSQFVPNMNFLGGQKPTIKRNFMRSF